MKPFYQHFNQKASLYIFHLEIYLYNTINEVQAMYMYAGKMCELCSIIIE